MMDVTENILKECSKCKKEKLLTCFTKDKYKKSGYTPQCTECRYLKKIENKEAVRESNRRQREKNIDKIKEYQKSKECKEYRKKYREKNREKIIENYDPEKRKKYYLKDRDNYIRKSNNYRKERKKKDPSYKMACNLRTRLYKALKGAYKTGSAVSDLGCSIQQFKKYIESLWQTGMSWENYNRNGWHLDHKMPISIFNLTNREELLMACHYTNLQPMWARDNFIKSNKIGA
jgi:hypothetical protein